MGSMDSHRLPNAAARSKHGDAHCLGVRRMPRPRGAGLASVAPPGGAHDGGAEACVAIESGARLERRRQRTPGGRSGKARGLAAAHSPKR